MVTAMFYSHAWMSLKVFCLTEGEVPEIYFKNERMKIITHDVMRRKLMNAACYMCVNVRKVQR